MRTYIPLNALRAFEAAARHLNFTRAAAELCVTPTAISHQVRTLEEFLHTPLFQRKGGKLILTPAASNALQELSEGFNKLESALQALNRRGRQRKLSVAASPSVASLWLMPKLNRFFASPPDVELSLCTVTGESDFSDGPFDVAICSTDDHPGRKVDYLMEDRIYPVCSPALLEDFGLTSEAALCELPLIHDDKVNDQFPTWRRFFEATQSAMRDVTCGLRFNQSSLAIVARALSPDCRRAGGSPVDDPFRSALPGSIALLCRPATRRGTARRAHLPRLAQRRGRSRKRFLARRKPAALARAGFSPTGHGRRSRTRRRRRFDRCRLARRRRPRRR